MNALAALLSGASPLSEEQRQIEMLRMTDPEQASQIEGMRAGNNRLMELVNQIGAQADSARDYRTSHGISDNPLANTSFSQHGAEGDTIPQMRGGYMHGFPQAPQQEQGGARVVQVAEPTPEELMAQRSEGMIGKRFGRTPVTRGENGIPTLDASSAPDNSGNARSAMVAAIERAGLGDSRELSFEELRKRYQQALSSRKKTSKLAQRAARQDRAQANAEGWVRGSNPQKQAQGNRILAAMGKANGGNMQGGYAQAMESAQQQYQSAIQQGASPADAKRIAGLAYEAQVGVIKEKQKLMEQEAAAKRLSQTPEGRAKLEQQYANVAATLGLKGDAARQFVREQMAESSGETTVSVTSDKTLEEPPEVKQIPQLNEDYDDPLESGRSFVESLRNRPTVYNDYMKIGQYLKQRGYPDTVIKQLQQEAVERAGGGKWGAALRNFERNSQRAGEEDIYMY